MRVNESTRWRRRMQKGESLGESANGALGTDWHFERYGMTLMSQQLHNTPNTKG